MTGRPEKLSVAILAGGKGLRIGGDKPLRTLAGMRLIDRAVELARSWSDEVFVVGRDPAQFGGVGVPVIMDLPGAEGPIAGLAAALQQAADNGSGLVLTIPCDTPFLPPDLAQRLGAAVGPLSGAAVAASLGVLHPSCASWRPRALEKLDSFLASGRLSLREFAAHVGFVTVHWTAEHRNPFFNVNSAQDLQMAEEMAGN